MTNAPKRPRDVNQNWRNAWLISPLAKLVTISQPQQNRPCRRGAGSPWGRKGGKARAASLSSAISSSRQLGRRLGSGGRNRLLPLVCFCLKLLLGTIPSIPKFLDQP